MAVSEPLNKPKDRRDVITDRNRNSIKILKISNGYTIQDGEGSIYAFTPDDEVVPEKDRLTAKEKVANWIEEKLDELEPTEGE